FFFQAEDGIRDFHVTGVQTCALPICLPGQPPGGVCNRDDVARQWWYVLVGIGNGAGPSKVKSVQPQQQARVRPCFPRKPSDGRDCFFLTQTRSPVELIWL